MSPIIELVEVKKDYQLGGTVVPALKGINLTVQPGELTAVVGPSGSGKSTLLNILGCLDRVTSGSYKLEGVEVGQTDFDDLAEIRNEKIGFIFQSFNLIPVLNVLENIELPCLLRARPESRAELRARAQKVAEEVGLGPVVHHRPDQLSGGQRQRVAIARALVTQPRLVLADEPTANLDSETSAQILALMLTMNREHGVTFLFSTHDPRVEKHAKRRLEISDGVLREAA
jgi:putative ABC transport system ATP-binding protein